MARAILAILTVLLSAFGAMMVYHNGHSRPDAFGFGLGVGACAGALPAFIEFARRK